MMLVIVGKKKIVRMIAAAVLFLSTLGVFLSVGGGASVETLSGGDGDFIKWVNFTVSCEAMQYALKLDVESQQQETPLHFIELLAYLAAKNGNSFKGNKNRQLDQLADQLRAGKTMSELTEKLRAYDYYLEAFNAIFAQYVGEYEVLVPNGEGKGSHWERRYGLKVFSPIAKGYPYSHYDDYGNSRSYGFRRVHLGNDLIGQVGTPIIAAEGGVVEALGWNQYGGWRIGIRSHDKMRYYYYAHLRKNYPYKLGLEVGSVVKSGDVIGYMGRSGYSLKENTNNIQKTHLHFGLQLIFDESQEDGGDEIWIDVYQIVKFLYCNRSRVIRDPETKGYSRAVEIREPVDDMPVPADG